MKQISWLALLVLVLAGSSPANADTTDAILRCDPGTLIKKIDGSGEGYKMAGHGAAFIDCAIPLSPGSHTLDVCFDASSTGWPVSVVLTCSENRKLAVDAQSGHTYRIKLDITGEWRTWIEDVTEAEAGLSYEKPPKKPKPAGSKKERETILILRATPEYAWLQLLKGTILGKWFNADTFGAVKLLNHSTKGVPDGYHVFRAYGGDSVGLIWGQMMIGSIFVQKQVMACGDFPVRVWEDLPPGKVLYLGHLTIKDAAKGYVGAYSDDLAEARAYIDSHHPELAGRLEAASFREARSPNLCRGLGFDLSAIP
jgi:hypothetical protein